MDSSTPHLKPAQSGYADINGLKMYYEVHGKGKPLVLLHGSLMKIGFNWSEMLPLLAGNRQVIAAEMQSHGHTRDISRKLSYEDMADDVSGLLRSLDIGSADIPGYSMGGGIAFQMGVRHPEQVRRLIGVSAPYRHDSWWPDLEASFAAMNPDELKDTPLFKEYVSLGNDPDKFGAFVKKVISIDLEPYDW